MTDTITKAQIQGVYAIGAALGLVERGNKEDNLHALVYSVTGKASVSALTQRECAAVEYELRQKARGSLAARLSAKGQTQKEPPTGMATRAQQGLAWRLVYRLRELDDGGAEPIDRLRGAIKKIIGVECLTQQPFRFVNASAAERLIEQLKRYVRSAERNARREDERGTAKRRHTG